MKMKLIFENFRKAMNEGLEDLKVDPRKFKEEINKQKDDKLDTGDEAEDAVNTAIVDAAKESTLEESADDDDEEEDE